MTQKLVFKRGNLVGDDHPLPAVAEVSLSLTCSFPSSIALLVDEPGTTTYIHIIIDMRLQLFSHLLIFLFNGFD